MNFFNVFNKVKRKLTSPSTLSQLLKQSEREFGTPKLTLELVPRTCFFDNVRTHVTQASWDVLRSMTYRHAGYVCQICGGVGEDHPVECHEIWEYQDQKKVQKLLGLIALCPACHNVKHFGFARANGREMITKIHLARVNGWTLDQTNQYIDLCFQIWNLRGIHSWTLDISWLKKYGVKLRKNYERQ